MAFLRYAWCAAAWSDEGFWNLDPIVLAGDIGAVAARRTLQKLIRAETADREAA